MSTHEEPIGEELTNDQINELCSFLREIDVMQKNIDIVNANAELKKGYEALCNNVNEIMKLLTNEQRDKVLETHRLQLIYLSEQEALKQKKKKIKK
jgi:hypothetical protein